MIDNYMQLVSIYHENVNNCHFYVEWKVWRCQIVQYTKSEVIERQSRFPNSVIYDVVNHGIPTH